MRWLLVLMLAGCGGVDSGPPDPAAADGGLPSSDLSASDARTPAQSGAQPDLAQLAVADLAQLVVAQSDLAPPDLARPHTGQCTGWYSCGAKKYRLCVDGTRETWFEGDDGTLICSSDMSGCGGADFNPCCDRATADYCRS